MTDAAPAAAFRRRLSLVAIIASISVVGITFGLMPPLISLLLEHEGADRTMIGLNTATAALAAFAVAPLVPRWIVRWGTAVTMYAGLVLITVATLLLPVYRDVWAWFPIRFAIGVGASVLFIVSETWINQIVIEGERGRAFGLYMMALSGGIGVGPLILLVTGTEGWTPFLAAAGCYALAAVPVLLAGRDAPRVVEQTKVPLVRFVALAPIGTGAGFILGLIDTTLVAMFPLYALAEAISNETALLMLTIYTGGGIVIPPLVGILADRFERIRLLLAVGGIAAATIALLPAVAHAPLLLTLDVFILGGTAASLYSLGLTILGQRFRGADLAAVNAVMISMFSAGSVIGPAVTGVAMDGLGALGFPLTLAGFALGYLVIVLARRARGHEGIA